MFPISETFRIRFYSENSMCCEHYLFVNSDSIKYWGCSDENDNMHAHIVSNNLKVERPPVSITRYKILKYTHQK
ncbi:unnamed protein product [Rotaria sordida]|uniref:Uncharacterized protein n=1 Tax=Rotaria sordida TaxID=392033 RepID=A0A818ZCS6_9BILA|nr:unnamed protein product [Rotaria sordida]CAF3767064.1 unnamed protein product [Rotaria sordida]